MATLKELMAAKKQQMAESSGRRATTVKPVVGKTRYRILPSWRGISDSQFYHDFGQHYIRPTADVKPTVYVCVEKTFNKPCALCDALREGFGLAKDDASKKLIRDSFASGRVLVNALEIDKDKTTPVILELSPSTFGKVVNIIEENFDEENDDFNIVTDLDNGVDITITRSGIGLATEYSVTPALKGSLPISKAVLANLNNLDQFVAQEQALALAKATNAVKEALGNVKKALPSSAKDIEFDEDVPAYSSDVIEGSSYNKDDKLSDDDLNMMLDELDD